MKGELKRRLLPLFLLLTLLLTSCTEQPRLRVSAGHMTITPYEAFLGARTWQQHGWLAADGLPIAGSWEEHADKLPTLRYNSNLRLIIRDDLITDSVTISVYNAEKPDKGLRSAKLSDFDDLPEGSYYVCITVYFLGEYIEAGNGHENPACSMLSSFKSNLHSERSHSPCTHPPHPGISPPTLIPSPA